MGYVKKEDSEEAYNKQSNLDSTDNKVEILTEFDPKQ